MAIVSTTTMPAIVETTATLVGLAFVIPIRAKTTLIPNPQAAEIAKINPNTVSISKFIEDFR